MKKLSWASPLEQQGPGNNLVSGPVSRCKWTSLHDRWGHLPWTLDRHHSRKLGWLACSPHRVVTTHLSSSLAQLGHSTHWRMHWAVFPFPRWPDSGISWVTLRTALRHCIGSTNCFVVISHVQVGSKGDQQPIPWKKPTPAEHGWPLVARLTASKVMSVDYRVLSCSAEMSRRCKFTSDWTSVKAKSLLSAMSLARCVILHISGLWIVRFWSILRQRDHHQGLTKIIEHTVTTTVEVHSSTTFIDMYLSARLLVWLVISCGARDTMRSAHLATALSNMWSQRLIFAVGGITFIFRSGGVGFLLDDYVNLLFNVGVSSVTTRRCVLWLNVVLCRCGIRLAKGAKI